MAYPTDEQAQAMTGDELLDAVFAEVKRVIADSPMEYLADTTHRRLYDLALDKLVEESRVPADA